MNALDLAKVGEFIQANIGPQFHEKKLVKISALTLNTIIKRKNPYLFRAKGSNSASDYIKSVLDASLSSGEESNFGDFIENVAIFVAGQVYDGRKSGIRGIDLEIEDGRRKYLVSIKSGPNWGNSGQRQDLVKSFQTASKILRTSGGGAETEIVCVEGCCYGIDDIPLKTTHQRLCGQRFWKFISGGHEALYRELIEPLGHEAEVRAKDLQFAYDAKLNALTASFVDQFCDEGVINWDRLIRFNSGGKSEQLASKAKASELIVDDAPDGGTSAEHVYDSPEYDASVEEANRLDDAQ
jgi:hypothetical protein